MTGYEKKQAVLVTEFDRYVMEHPELAAQIPIGAQVVIQVEGDGEFNLWAKALAQRQREQGQAVVFVHVKGLYARRTLGSKNRSSRRLPDRPGVHAMFTHRPRRSRLRGSTHRTDLSTDCCGQASRSGRDRHDASRPPALGRRVGIRAQRLQRNQINETSQTNPINQTDPRRSDAMTQ